MRGAGPNIRLKRSAASRPGVPGGGVEGGVSLRAESGKGRRGKPEPPFANLRTTVESFVPSATTQSAISSSILRRISAMFFLALCNSALMADVIAVGSYDPSANISGESGSSSSSSASAAAAAAAAGVERGGLTGSGRAEEILRGRAEHLLGASHRRLHRGVDRGHPRRRRRGPARRPGGVRVWRRFGRGRRRGFKKVGFHSPSDVAAFPRSLRRGCVEGKLGGRAASLGVGGVGGGSWTPGRRRAPAGGDRVRGAPAAEQLSLELLELLNRSPRPGGLERRLERRDVGGVDRITREYGGVDVLRRGVWAHVARVLAERVDQIRVGAVREEPRGDWPLAIPASLVQRGVALRVGRIDVEALADAVLEDDAEAAQVAARGGGEQRRRPRGCPRRVRHPRSEHASFRNANKIVDDPTPD